MIVDIGRALMYLDRDTAMHRLNPVTKVVLIMITIIFAIIIDRLIGLALLLVSTMILGLLIGFNGVRRVLEVMRFVAIIMLSIALLGIALYTATNGFSYVYIHDAGIGYLKALLRMEAVTVVVTLFMMTTTPSQIISVISIGKGFAWLYAVLALYRFIPIMLRDVAEVYEAQISRGIPLDQGNLFRRAKMFFAIIVPATISALLRAKEFSEALEVRCFGGSEKRSYLYRYSFTKLDVAILSTYIAIDLTILSMEPAFQLLP